MRIIKFKAIFPEGHWAGRIIEDYTSTDMFANLGFWYNEGIYLQYTGLNDMMGTEIYDGDVTIIDGRLHVVEFNKCYFDFTPQKAYANTLERYHDEIIILGNIHTHPQFADQFK